MAVGGCTNILFNDGFLDICVIKPGRDFDFVLRTESSKSWTCLHAGASCSLQKLVVEAARLGCDLSFLAGIPGTVGGAVLGNCGNKKTGIVEFVEKIEFISTEKNGPLIRERTLNAGDYSYRFFNKGNLKVLTDVYLKIPAGSDRNSIFKKIRHTIKEKKAAQPTKALSAGCFFKNPGPDISAGELIDRCGLKNFMFGGARVSVKHANFIENAGNATARDIFILSKIIKHYVVQRFNIELEYEVRLAGFE
jgi:UDP-N-acetylmuramate dehydrogenase